MSKNYFFLKILIKVNGNILGVYLMLSINFIFIGRKVDNVVKYYSNSIALNHTWIIVNIQSVFILDLGKNEDTFLYGFR